MLEFIKKYDKKVFYSILVVISAIAITIWALPQRVRFKEEIRKGQPWMHPTKFAEFDFPIKKSKEQLIKETDSIKRTITPFYSKNHNVSKKYLTLFEDDLEKKKTQYIEFEKKLPFNKRKIKKIESEIDELNNTLKTKLKEIYEKGIIELNVSYEDINKNDQLKISLMTDNVGEVNNINDFYKLTEAYTELKNTFDEFEKKEIKKDYSISFEKYLGNNIFYEKELTQKYSEQSLQEISPVFGMVQKGEIIVSKGELVNDLIYLKLESLKDEIEISTKKYSDTRLLLIGQTSTVAIIYVIFFLFLFFYNKQEIPSIRKILYFYSIIILFIVVTAVFSRYSHTDAYMIPVTIILILSLTFFDAIYAFAHFLTAVLIIGFIAPNGFEYVFIQFVAGSATTFGLSKMHSRSQLLKTAGLILSAYIVVYTGITLMQENSFDKFDIYKNKLFWFTISSFLVLLVYPLIYVFERIFGFLSDVTLIEITNTNRPLLRLLAEKAPGTFQHVVQVANLSEEAVRKINGDSLLIRAGALYHDIGKIESSEYFTENQQQSGNPHSKLTPVESASIIINHVTRGLQLAKKYRLPEKVAKFIVTHHGKSTVKWFLHSHRQQNPDDKNIEPFTYKGELPFSKETAVLMMADALEAASRSLDEYSNENIDNLVEKIVNIQISEKQFDEADITLAEINTVKEVLKIKLKNIYHTRIKYPEEQ